MSFIDVLKQVYSGVSQPTIISGVVKETPEQTAERLRKQKQQQVMAYTPPVPQTPTQVPEEKKNFIQKFIASINEPIHFEGKGAGYTPMEQPPEDKPERPVQRMEIKDNPYADWTKEQLRADVRPDVIEYVDSKVIPSATKYGVPAAVAASQWAIEGGRDTSKPNPFGLMKGGKVISYGDLEANIKAYADTVSEIAATNMGKDSDNFNLADYDPETILHYLEFTDVPELQKLNSNDPALGTPGVSRHRYEAHLKNPQDYIDMIHAMPEWRYYSK